MASPRMSPAQYLFSIVVPISILLASLPSSVRPLSFKFPDLNVDVNNITLVGDASIGEGGNIELTKKQVPLNQNYTTGRAAYKHPLQLWDKASGNLTDFVTHFSFKILNASSGKSTVRGSGMAFFLAPFPSDEIPLNSQGGYLGLFNNSANQFVAVEFDSFDGAYDPYTNNSHVGIDVDSVFSTASVPLGTDIVTNSTAHVSIIYNAGSKNLSVVLYCDPQPQASLGRQTGWNLSSTIDLQDYLPEMVAVGFSGSTFVGDNYTVRGAESHTILSWDFSSTLVQKENSTAAIDSNTRSSMRLFLEIFMGIIVFAFGVCLPWFALWCKKMRPKRKDDHVELSDDDGAFDNGGRGPNVNFLNPFSICNQRCS